MKFLSEIRRLSWIFREKPRARKSRTRSPIQLALEALEDRTVPSVLPAPIVSNPHAIPGTGNDVSPVVVSDPLLPQRLVAVYTTGTGVGGSFSTDGGQTWSQFRSTANNNNLKDPTQPINNGADFHPFAQDSSASVAFDRQDDFYVVFTEHSVANDSGVLVLEKYSFANSATPTQLITDKVLSQWLLGVDPVLNPVVGVDANLPTFSDVAPNGTTQTQTDTMVVDPTTRFPKAVYVAWNTSNTAPTGATNFNPNTIKVVASGDGGLTFTTQEYVNDGTANPNFFDPARGPEHDAAPQIVFTQGSADGAVPGGQLTFVWNDFGRSRIVVDNTQPDGGVQNQAAAEAVVLSSGQLDNSTTGPTAGHITDGVESGGGPNNTDAPDGISSTPFTLTLSASDAAILAGKLADLTVSLNIIHPHMGQVSLTLTGFDAAGNPFLGTDPITHKPVGVTLLNASIGPDGSDTGKGMRDASGKAVDATNLGEFNVPNTSNPTDVEPLDHAGLFANLVTTFDQQAPRSITDPGAVAPYIAHFRPEDGGLNSRGLELYRNLTQAQLAGSKWVLTITDDRNDADDNTKPDPVQFLQDWSLNFTSSISTSGFGTDTNTQAGVTPVTGVATGPAPQQGANGQFPQGIGPGIVTAVDNTLGSYSPYQGRMYIAYVGPGQTTNGHADDTDIYLIASDDGGKSWGALTDPTTRSHAVRVNQDSASDGFSEGNRPKFLPALAVDQTTGTVVVSWFDTRWDASRARPTDYLSASIDGGQTFGGESFLNTTKTATDAITGQTVALQPVPNSTEANAGTLGFGDRQGLVVNAGHVVPIFAGNVNTAGVSLQSDAVAIAAGPRIVSGDMGPIVNDFSSNFVSYNNTFASDGTRQFTGFVVTFDRPVDATTFTTGEATVTYESPTGTIAPMTVQSVTPLDASSLFGPRGVGGFDSNGKPTLATTFLISVIDPATGAAPSRVGTYSYTVGPAIMDRVRSVANQVVPTGFPVSGTSTDDPQTVQDSTTTTGGTTTTSHLVVSGAPAGTVISSATVTVDITNYPFVGDLQLTLTGPDGSSVLLFDQRPSPGGGNSNNPGLGPITFDDTASRSLSQGFAPYSGTFRPEQPLSGLLGGQINGTWTLTVKDLFTGNNTDQGQLQNWTINIQPGKVTPVTRTGNKMDQNANGATGEASSSAYIGDVFAIPRPLAGGPGIVPFDQNTLPLIIPGPHVVATSVPNGVAGAADNEVLNAAANSIDVTFDRDMNTATFVPANVLRIMGPLGLIPLTDANGNSLITVTADPNKTGSKRTFRIGFPTQVINGTYTLTFSPNILDVNGNAVDTNLNAGVDVLRQTANVGGTTSTLTFPTGNVNVALPPGRTVVSTLTIPNSAINNFLIQGATLQLNIDNNSQNLPIDPFLTASLLGPNGQQVRLFTQVGDNRTPNGFLNTIFDDNASTPIQQGVPPFNVGTFNPQTPLSVLNGANAVGNWQLIITNASTNLTGTLNNWTLKLNKLSPATGLGESVADQFTAHFRIFTADPTNPLTHEDWFAVGPASENSGGNSGRVTGLAVDPSDPSGNTVFAGGASGGVWKTTNFLTNDSQGPTWIPLTDFGPTFAINIGAIAVFARNGDPKQSIVIVGTGEGDTGTPGVGFLISQDGGATWTVLDSTTNVDANGNALPINSPLRDHMFVGTNSFKIAVDPKLNSNNQVNIYAALSGKNGGIWVSKDTGKTWGIETAKGNGTTTPDTRVANLAGNATDVALSNESTGTDGNLQVVFAAIQGTGVFVSQNEGSTFTQTAPPYQGDQQFREGSGSVPVANPTDSPNGAKGRIALVTPFATGNKLEDFFYEGWVYAAVVKSDGNFDGLYVSKDFGGNWTKVRLPEVQGAWIPTNDISAANKDINVTGFGQFVQGNYDLSLAIDPTNPNVVYIGGTDDAAPESAGGEIRVDTTGVADPHALVAYDNTKPDGGLVQAATTGAVTVQVPGGSTTVNGVAGSFLNLFRDPNNPFLTSSTVNLTNVAQFNNDGTGIRKWTSFSDVMGGSTDQHRVVSFVDPLTGHGRLIFADDQGVWTGVDMGDGTLDLGIGTATAPTFSRNGNLQIAQFYGGTSQPSILASQIAGALFYGEAQDDGFPKSDPNILQNGNLNWTGPTGDGTWVVTDQTGGGTMLDYKWPCCNPLTATDFLQITRPGSKAVGDTGTIGASLLQPGDNPGQGQGEWPFTGGSRFAINPIDPNGLAISSQAGRVFRTTDQGLHWFVIGAPTDLDSTYAQAIAFGAPDPSATSGQLDDFIYAGTTGGKIFVTFQGGGFQNSTKWLDISTGLDGSSVQQIVTDPRRGSHDAYAVTSGGVFFMANSLPSASNPTPTWVKITGNLFSITHNPFGNAALNEAQLKYLTTIAADWRFALPDNPANPSGPNHPILYVGGEGGVYRSTDKGKTWKLFPDVKDDGATQDGGLLPDAHITNLTLVQGNVNPANGAPNQPGGPDLLLATTYGRGMFAIHLPMAGQTTPVPGVRVLSAVPNGTSTVSSLTVTFAGPVNPTTFTLADIVRFVGPNGAVAVTGVTEVPPGAGADQFNVYRIDFAPQTTSGAYSLTFGPNIADFAGDYMDENQNGVNGEAPADEYTANFFVKASVDNNVHPVPVVLGLSGSGLEALFPSGSGFSAAAAGVFPTLAAGQHWVDALVGDFNGDGLTDYAARVLETGQWYVAVSNGSMFSARLWDTWSPAVTWVDVAAGYFQGHGKPEDIVGRVLQPDANGFSDVFVSVPNANLNSGTTILWDQWQGRNADGTITQWLDTRVGDFNGDGKDDLVAGFFNYNVPALIPGTNPPQFQFDNFRDVFVAQSNGSSFSQIYWQSWFDYNTTSPSAPRPPEPWANVVVGDFKGDGMDAVAARFAPNGALYLSVDFPTTRTSDREFGNNNINNPHGQLFWQQWSSSANWVDVKVGHFLTSDVNATTGKPKDELMARDLNTGNVFVSDLYNPNYDYDANFGHETDPGANQYLWTNLPSSSSWVDTQVGDFNGDGLSDFVARFAPTGQWFVWYSTGSNATGFAQRVFAATWDPSMVWVDVLVGPQF